MDGTSESSRASSRRLAVIILSVSSKRGTFISFEGLDGCGKSTQIERLAGKLREQKLPVIVTREPGGTPAGERIRQLLLDTKVSGVKPLAEMALMFACRAQHVGEIIVPALASGAIVLCDRFTDSTEAYQGAGRQLGTKAVLALHHILCEDLWPDLTILMDCDLAASIERARRRNQGRIASEGADENRFELENRAFFKRVHAAYLEIAKREPERVVTVDARGTADQSHRKILEIVAQRLSSMPLSGKAQHGK